MEERAGLDAEQVKAQEQAHLQLARIAKQIRDYQEDPQAALDAMDVAPHLRNRV